MRRLASALTVSFALAATPIALLAHEGHGHKVMGTVTMVHVSDVTHVEVKTKEGETVVLTVNDQTKYTKGKVAASLKDVKAGVRIVATVAMEGATTKALAVQIAEDKAPKAPAASEHHH